MTTLADLPTTFEPRSTKEWIMSFSPEERDIIHQALRVSPPSVVYQTITKLDENPYRFSLSALQDYARALKGAV
ncbi:hypothetical protein [Corynebacterium heidelbergense]|uniref:Uncharacterized protein n=1 Tax=Corynebacterium heidelbergense TaxID=2055947 RepID=A0A364VE31_9CORY|nr:hypothetical protein [Corynebacterium heidelbergense]RAV34900.1 hypothetical protein CWC39_00745 [Corynebacterium heidelbergense]WCZ36035.1 hypothetical protein CHEID_02340 [Corynebacterium heidelbergense]